MAQVILFGGGDAGGFYIDANGRLHKIPPFDPYVSALARSFGALVRAETRARDAGDKAEIASLADTMQKTLVTHVERFAGLSGAASIVGYDPEDGFVCGNGGRFPIPRPHNTVTAALEAVTAN